MRVKQIRIDNTIEKLYERRKKKSLRYGGTKMERFAWKAVVLPGMLNEYKRRHNEIWPEMTAMLNEAGIHNYTIWNVGDELFGYYECESIEHASRVQNESPVVKRWNESMAPLMRMVADGRKGEGGMVQVFYHP